MKIDYNHFDNTALGMRHAVDYVKYRMSSMLALAALDFGARELRRIANQMDKIRQEIRQEMKG